MAASAPGMRSENCIQSMFWGTYISRVKLLLNKSNQAARPISISPLNELLRLHA